MEEEGGAIRSTAGQDSIIPRREAQEEQLAPSEVSLGEKKRQRQSGIALRARPALVCAIWDYVGSDGQRGGM